MVTDVISPNSLLLLMLYGVITGSWFAAGEQLRPGQSNLLTVRVYNRGAMGGKGIFMRSAISANLVPVLAVCLAGSLCALSAPVYLDETDLTGSWHRLVPETPLPDTRHAFVVTGISEKERR